MRIRIIVEGSTRLDRRRGRWGLSLLIDKDVLFDTFADARLLASGFRKYAVDPAALRHIVISHDHWDHTGGLSWVLARAPGVTVWVPAGVSDHLKSEIAAAGGVVVEVKGPALIREGVRTTGQIQGKYAGRSIMEQSVVLDQGRTLALCTGCSHPGILVILTAVRRQFAGKAIDLVLGGLHLADADEDELRRIAEQLAGSFDVTMVAPFHCTGRKAIRYFKTALSRRLIRAGSGDLFVCNDDGYAWKKQAGRGE
ncbi:MAG TPA: MBL fold metallo-hydrolase [Spirochaetia bacterium]|nr:MBL fold metallo-hydrolase [Spirochaetia bacterium]